MGVATVSQVASFPRAPPQANPLQNESLGLPTLGNQRINIRVASPSLGSCCVWRNWPFVLEGKGPSPTFPPSGTGTGRKGRGGLVFPPLLSLPQNCIIKIPIQSSHGWGGGEKKENRKPYPRPYTFNCDRRRHLAGGRWSQENSYKFKFDDGYN